MPKGLSAWASSLKAEPKPSDKAPGPNSASKIGAASRCCTAMSAKSPRPSLAPSPLDNTAPALSKARATSALPDGSARTRRDSSGAMRAAMAAKYAQ